MPEDERVIRSQGCFAGWASLRGTDPIKLVCEDAFKHFQGYMFGKDDSKLRTG